MRYSKAHPLENVIGNINDSVQTRSQVNQIVEQDHLAFVSQVEPKSIEEALKENSWIDAMHKELGQFQQNNVWSLVPRTPEISVIGTRWVFRNKLNEEGKVVKNNASFIIAIPKGLKSGFD